MDNIIFKAIIDHAIDGIVITDADGIILLSNSSAERMFSYEAAGLPGKALHNLFSVLSLKELTGKEMELKALRENGTQFAARVASCEAHSEGFAVVANFIQDISNEKTAEDHLQYHAQNLEETVKERTEVLRAAIAQLEITQEETQGLLMKEKQIGQMKSRFVSMASHEFRSPLSRIQLSASIIESFYEKLDRSKIMEHLQKIKGTVAELTNTLDDFLSVEKIDSGRVTPSLTAFNLRNFVEDVCEEMSFLRRDSQRIACFHTGELNVFTLDKALLKHCLANLFSNACKYSDSDGLIEVLTVVDNDMILISVADDGIGIPGHEQERLFEAFFRASNARDIAGTGLGLNIVKSYTELMGGKVSYEALEPRGSKFLLSFPITAQSSLTESMNSQTVPVNA